MGEEGRMMRKEGHAGRKRKKEGKKEGRKERRMVRKEGG